MEIEWNGKKSWDQWFFPCYKTIVFIPWCFNADEISNLFHAHIRKHCLLDMSKDGISPNTSCSGANSDISIHEGHFDLDDHDMQHQEPLSSIACLHLYARLNGSYPKLGLFCNDELEVNSVGNYPQPIKRLSDLERRTPRSQPWKVPMMKAVKMNFH